jgi:predicted ArsR family transcriptional regulator
MIDLLAGRQRQVVSILSSRREGCSVDELAEGLAITKNAVRQHLVTLERDGLVEMRGTLPTGGRPRELYTLTDKGRELFPRQYSWFAELLVGLLKEQLGSPRLKEKLYALGQRVGQSLASQSVAGASRAERAEQLAAAMAEIGYQARHLPGSRTDQTIEAKNCVFHRLAERHPEVCQFDLGLMGAFAQTTVAHEECMVRGGSVCRFKLSSSSKPAASNR